MNCCDYKCNQGQNCPARGAKIKQRYPAADPLPPTRWREMLADFAAALGLVVVAAMAAWVIVLVVML